MRKRANSLRLQKESSEEDFSKEYACNKSHACKLPPGDSVWAIVLAVCFVQLAAFVISVKDRDIFTTAFITITGLIMASLLIRYTIKDARTGGRARGGNALGSGQSGPSQTNLSSTHSSSKDRWFNLSSVVLLGLNSGLNPCAMNFLFALWYVVGAVLSSGSFSGRLSSWVVRGGLIYISLLAVFEPVGALVLKDSHRWIFGWTESLNFFICESCTNIAVCIFLFSKKGKNSLLDLPVSAEPIVSPTEPVDHTNKLKASVLLVLKNIMNVLYDLRFILAAILIDLWALRYPSVFSGCFAVLANLAAMGSSVSIWKFILGNICLWWMVTYVFHLKTQSEEEIVLDGFWLILIVRGIVGFEITKSSISASANHPNKTKTDPSDIAPVNPTTYGHILKFITRNFLRQEVYLGALLLIAITGPPSILSLFVKLICVCSLVLKVINVNTQSVDKITRNFLGGLAALIAGTIVVLQAPWVRPSIETVGLLLRLIGVFDSSLSLSKQVYSWLLIWLLSALFGKSEIPASIISELQTQSEKNSLLKLNQWTDRVIQTVSIGAELSLSGVDPADWLTVLPLILSVGHVLFFLKNSNGKEVRKMFKIQSSVCAVLLLMRIVGNLFLQNSVICSVRFCDERKLKSFLLAVILICGSLCWFEAEMEPPASDQASVIQQSEYELASRVVQTIGLLVLGFRTCLAESNAWNFFVGFVTIIGSFSLIGKFQTFTMNYIGLLFSVFVMIFILVEYSARLLLLLKPEFKTTIQWFGFSDVNLIQQLALLAASIMHRAVASSYSRTTTLTDQECLSQDVSRGSVVLFAASLFWMGHYKGDVYGLLYAFMGIVLISKVALRRLGDVSRLWILWPCIIISMNVLWQFSVPLWLQSKPGFIFCFGVHELEICNQEWGRYLGLFSLNLVRLLSDFFGMTFGLLIILMSGVLCGKEDYVKNSVCSNSGLGWFMGYLHIAVRRWLNRGILRIFGFSVARFIGLFIIFSFGFKEQISILNVLVIISGLFVLAADRCSITRNFLRIFVSVLTLLQIMQSVYQIPWFKCTYETQYKSVSECMLLQSNPFTHLIPPLDQATTQAQPINWLGYTYTSLGLLKSCGVYTGSVLPLVSLCLALAIYEDSKCEDDGVRWLRFGRALRFIAETNARIGLSLRQQRMSFVAVKQKLQETMKKADFLVGNSKERQQAVSSMRGSDDDDDGPPDLIASVSSVDEEEKRNIQRMKDDLKSQGFDSESIDISFNICGPGKAAHLLELCKDFSVGLKQSTDVIAYALRHRRLAVNVLPTSVNLDTPQEPSTSTPSDTLGFSPGTVNSSGDELISPPLTETVVAKLDESSAFVVRSVDRGLGSFLSRHIEDVAFLSHPSEPLPVHRSSDGWVLLAWKTILSHSRLVVALAVIYAFASMPNILSVIQILFAGWLLLEWPVNSRKSALVLMAINFLIYTAKVVTFFVLKSKSGIASDKIRHSLMLAGLQPLKTIDAQFSQSNHSWELIGSEVLIFLAILLHREYLIRLGVWEFLQSDHTMTGVLRIIPGTEEKLLKESSSSESGKECVDLMNMESPRASLTVSSDSLNSVAETVDDAAVFACERFMSGEDYIASNHTELKSTKDIPGIRSEQEIVIESVQVMLDKYRRVRWECQRLFGNQTAIRCPNSVQQEDAAQHRTWFQRVFRQNAFKDRLKSGVDLYTLIFFLGMLMWLTVLFGYNSMSMSSSDSTASDHSFKLNHLSGTLAMLLCAHMALMVWDRAVYSARTQKSFSQFKSDALGRMSWESFFAGTDTTKPSFRRGSRAYTQDLSQNTETTDLNSRIEVLRFIILCLLTIGLHVGILFRVFRVNSQFPSKTMIFYYLIFAAYLILSTQQIRAGFPLIATDGLRPNVFNTSIANTDQPTSESPKNSKKNSIYTSEALSALVYLYVRLSIFIIHKSIPFLNELGIVIDWTVRSTSLPLGDYFNLQDAFNTVWKSALFSELMKYDWPGEKIPGFPSKSLVGCGFIFIIMFCLLFPILIFSSIVPHTVLPVVANAELAIYARIQKSNLGNVGNAVGDVPWERIEQSVSVRLFESEMIGSLEKLKNESGEQHIQFDGYTNMEISTQRKAEILGLLQQTLGDTPLTDTTSGNQPASNPQPPTQPPNLNTKIELRISQKVRREAEGITPIHDSFSSTLCACEITQLCPECRSEYSQLKSVVMMFVSDQSVGPENLAGLLPQKVSLPSQDDIAKIKAFQGLSVSKSPERGVMLSSITPPDTQSSQRAQAHHSAASGCLEIAFELRPVYASASPFISLIKMGLVGVYVTIVFAIGRFMRALFADSSKRVIYEVLPHPQDLLDICYGIGVAQSNSDLKREYQLFECLRRILRSPETLLNLTGHEVQERGRGRLDKPPFPDLIHRKNNTNTFRLG